MKNKNLISEGIPADVVKQVIESIGQINNALAPFYKTLPTDERINVIGNERFGLLMQAMKWINTNPEYLPRTVDIQELKNDHQLMMDSREISSALQVVLNNLNIIYFLASADTYDTILDYYNTVKRSADSGDRTAKSIYDDLSPFFEKFKKKVQKED